MLTPPSNNFCQKIADAPLGARKFLRGDDMIGDVQTAFHTDLKIVAHAADKNFIPQEFFSGRS
jgi:hypothetical protein